MQNDLLKVCLQELSILLLYNEERTKECNFHIIKRRIALSTALNRLDEDSKLN